MVGDVPGVHHHIDLELLLQRPDHVPGDRVEMDVGDVQHPDRGRVGVVERQSGDRVVQLRDVGHQFGELGAVGLESGDDRLGAADQRGGGGDQARVPGLHERAWLEGGRGDSAGAGQGDGGGQQAVQGDLGAAEDDEGEDQGAGGGAEQGADHQDADAVAQVAFEDDGEAVGEARVLDEAFGLLLVDVLQGDAEQQRGVVGAEGEGAEGVRVDDRLAGPGGTERHPDLHRPCVRPDGAAQENAEPGAHGGHQQDRRDLGRPRPDHCSKAVGELHTHSCIPRLRDGMHLP